MDTPAEAPPPERQSTPSPEVIRNRRLALGGLAAGFIALIIAIVASCAGGGGSGSQSSSAVGGGARTTPNHRRPRGPRVHVRQLGTLPAPVQDPATAPLAPGTVPASSSATPTGTDTTATSTTPTGSTSGTTDTTGTETTATTTTGPGAGGGAPKGGALLLGGLDTGDSSVSSIVLRSEERRVGKECRSQGSPNH